MCWKGTKIQTVRGSSLFLSGFGSYEGSADWTSATVVKNVNENLTSPPFKRFESWFFTTRSVWEIKLELMREDRLKTRNDTVKSNRPRGTGGYFWEFVVGVFRLVLQILTLLQTQKLTFSTLVRFQTWPVKSIPAFRPVVGRNYVTIT